MNLNLSHLANHRRDRRQQLRREQPENQAPQAWLAASFASELRHNAQPASAATAVARIVNGTPTSEFKSVGLIGDRSGFFCTGTLIGSRYVLTAGHCAEGVANTNGRFKINGQTYSTSAVYLHPNYNGNTLANDIAIYKLNQDVAGVTPTEIFRGTPRVGQQLTLVGFGAGGTGTTGHNNDFGIKRVGTTNIDGVTAKQITWDFDNNSESNTAPGDSGGPAFLKVNGVYQIAGVTSGGDKANAGIGDHSFDTRVDAYQTWIDGIVGSSGGGGGGGGGGGAIDDHANSPNSSATLIALNQLGNGAGRGKLETKGDRDVFKFNVSKSGTATIKANGVNGLDTYLRVYDSSGKLIAQNDDIGQSLNSQVKLNVKSGVYYASVGSYRDSETGNYTLSVQLRAASARGDDHGNTFATASSLVLNNQGRGVANGRIENGTDVDMFRFQANAAGRFSIAAKRLSGNIDTVLSVYDSNNRLIARNDDFGNSVNSQVSLNLGKGQSYFVRLSSYGSSNGDYSLTVQQANSLAAAAQRQALNVPSIDLTLPRAACRDASNSPQLTLAPHSAMTASRGQRDGIVDRLHQPVSWAGSLGDDPSSLLASRHQTACGQLTLSPQTA